MAAYGLSSQTIWDQLLAMKLVTLSTEACQRGLDLVSRVASYQ